MTGANAVKTGRVYFLDELRGLVVLLMIAYHAMYDVVYVFGFNVPWFRSWWADNLWQPFIACNFILIAGVSCRYSRSNLKRGLVTLGLGALMTIVTRLVMPDQIIRFGVLHLLGSCMLLYALFHRPSRETDTPAAFIGAIIAFLLFLSTCGVPSGYLGITPFELPLPEWLYSTDILFPLGFPNAGFFSSDYFPLIPWVFLFMTGSFIGVFFKRGDMPGFFYRPHLKPLAKIGHHALIIYLLHQPVIYGLGLLLVNMMK